jgi:hypothetical protein
VIERPAYDLTLFKVHFGLLTLKGYTKGERVLRFEAIVHNTKTLKTGRALEKFPDIVARLAGMAGRFCTMLDCVDTGFIPDGTLDELPLPSQIGAVRTGGIDLNKPRSRAVLAAALALAIAPGGFTVAEFAAKVRAMTGQAAGTSSHPPPPGSSAPCSPSGKTSSRPCWPASPTRGSAALPATGPTSTGTTRRYAWR